MSQLRYLFLACSITFFACSEKIAGTWEEENTLAINSSSSDIITASSSSIIANSSAESSSSGTAESSSSEKPTSSSSVEKQSSSSKDIVSSSSQGGIHIPPPNVACVAAAPTKIVSYGVVDAFIEKRVETLEEQGLDRDSAKSIAEEELYRELGLDSLFQDIPWITDEQLEYTLFYLYGEKNSQNEEILKPALVEDFADGTLKPSNYCINDTSFARLDKLPFEFMPLGCGYPDAYVNHPIAILRNIWRKCANMPYCNDNVGDTIITIGKDHFVCEDSSWQTLEMLGKEMNGIICTENGTRIKTKEHPRDSKESTFICYENYWINIKSSVTLPAEYFFNPNFEYGSFTDPRDGHVYKTTVFNGQTWLAQDIDYYDSSDTLFTKQSLCPQIPDFKNIDENKNKYCDGTSRFYSIKASKKACPEGWRLPTMEDWSFIENMDNSKLIDFLPKLFVIGSYVSGTRDATDEFGLSLRASSYIDYFLNRISSQEYNNYFWLEEDTFVVTETYKSVLRDFWQSPDTFAFAGEPEPNYKEKRKFIPVRCIKK